MARAVTITEFKEWLRRPDILGLTWYRPFKPFEDEVAEDFKDIKRDMIVDKMNGGVKYLDIGIDTRDMKIWRISGNGGYAEAMSIRDSAGEEETILDEMEKQMRKVTDGEDSKAKV